MTRDPNHADHDLQRRLADLAVTVADDPGRAAGVEALVRRRHQRRAVARSATGVALAAVTVGGLVLVRSAGGGGGGSGGPVGASTLASTAPTTTAAASLPACSVPAGGVPAGPSTAVAPDGRAAEAKAVTSGGGVPGPGLTTGAPGTGAVTPVQVTGFKGLGTVRSVTDTEITIDLAAEAKAVPADAPTSVTARFLSTTVYLDAGVAATTRPAVAAGDRVLFGATGDGSGTFDLVQLEVHPVEKAVGSGAGSAGGVIVGTGELKIEGDVVTASDGTMTVRVTDGALPADGIVTATAAGDTEWYAGGQACAAPTLADGTHVVAVLGQADATGTYRVRSVDVAPAPGDATAVWAKAAAGGADDKTTTTTAG